MTPTKTRNQDYFHTTWLTRISTEPIRKVQLEVTHHIGLVNKSIGSSGAKHCETLKTETYHRGDVLGEFKTCYRTNTIGNSLCTIPEERLTSSWMLGGDTTTIKGHRYILKKATALDSLSTCYRYHHHKCND